MFLSRKGHGLGMGNEKTCRGREKRKGGGGGRFRMDARVLCASQKAGMITLNMTEERKGGEKEKKKEECDTNSKSKKGGSPLRLCGKKRGG